MSNNENMSWIKGLVDTVNCYEFEEKLPGSKRLVKFRPSTPKQLKKFLLNENEENIYKIENIIDSMISDSILDPEFNIDELYMQDRFFLFFCIRLRSKGSKIESTEKCSKCKSQFLSTISFDDVTATELDDDVNYNIKFNDNLELELKFITRKDQKEILNLLKKTKFKNKKEELIQLAFMSYAASINSIKFNGTFNEDLKLEDKMYFIENTSEDIFNKIKKWNDDNDFGVSLSFTKQCPHCKNEYTISVNSQDLL